MRERKVAHWVGVGGDREGSWIRRTKVKERTVRENWRLRRVYLENVIFLTDLA